MKAYVGASAFGSRKVAGGNHPKDGRDDPMTSKILRRMTLVAGALSLAIAISAQSVLADNDDDDERRGGKNRSDQKSRGKGH